MLSDTSTASGNTLIGLCAGHPITTGGCNTIIGHCAGYSKNHHVLHNHDGN